MSPKGLLKLAERLTDRTGGGVMPGRVEYSTGPRSLDTFPKEWVPSPGDSEERAAWILRHVKLHLALRAGRPARSAAAAAALAKAKSIQV